MREVGMKLTCNCCSKSIFLRRIDRFTNENGAVLDKYEDFPKGWKRNNDRDFCPECAKKY